MPASFTLFFAQSVSQSFILSSQSEKRQYMQPASTHIIGSRCAIFRRTSLTLDRTAQTVAITVEHLTKTYGDAVALDEVSLHIEDGDFAVLLGPTGSGKTTLLRIMAGVERPDSGRVLYDGVDMRRVPVQKRPIAMVYQQFVNYPSMTVYENIASPLRVRRPRLSRTEIDKRVMEAAELLRIEKVLRQKPEEVSGGQQQRTAIARALVKGAQYIFLDEPLANLDFKLREDLRGELKHLFGARKGAVIYATPEPIDALSMATHVGLLQEGSLRQYGRVREVYESPEDISVGTYFSHPTMNIAPGKVEMRDGSTRLRISKDLCIELSAMQHDLNKDEYFVGIRAHALDVTRKHERDLPFSATVEFAEVYGSDTEVHILHENLHLTVLTERVLKFTPGEHVEFFMDPRNLHLFDHDTSKLIAKTPGG